MSPDDDLMLTAPPGVPGLDRDHPAQSRPGEVAPSPVHAELPVYDGVSIDAAILAAYMLRRSSPGHEYWTDPAWPRLHLILDLARWDLADLVAAHPHDRAAAHRRDWVEWLLTRHEGRR
jgi:hypothetical protein